LIKYLKLAKKLKLWNISYKEWLCQ